MLNTVFKVIFIIKSVKKNARVYFNLRVPIFVLKVTKQQQEACFVNKSFKVKS